MFEWVHRSLYQSSSLQLILEVIILYIGNLILIWYFLIGGVWIFWIPIVYLFEKKEKDNDKVWEEKYKIWRNDIRKKWYWFVLSSLVWSLVPIYLIKTMSYFK